MDRLAIQQRNPIPQHPRPTQSRRTLEKIPHPRPRQKLGHLTPPPPHLLPHHNPTPSPPSPPPPHHRTSYAARSSRFSVSSSLTIHTRTSSQAKQSEHGHLDRSRRRSGETYFLNSVAQQHHIFSPQPPAQDTPHGVHTPARLPHSPSTPPPPRKRSKASTVISTEAEGEVERPIS